MKKTLTTLITLSSFLSATIPDGYTNTQKQKFVNANATGFSITDSSMENGVLHFSCKDGVVYISLARGGALSFNPKTKEPYYCKVKITGETESSFGDRARELLQVTVRHKYTDTNDKP